MNVKTFRSRIFVPVLFFAALLLAAAGAPVLGVGERDFLIRSFSPQGAVTADSKIKAVFSTPVVSEDAVGKTLDAGDYPFEFSPRLSGAGVWLDNVTFVFTPGAFSPATRYTATAREDLRDREGRLLSGKQSFSFETKALEFIGARQTDFDAGKGRASFELEFSLPVSPARLRGYLEVKNASGGRLNYGVVQNPPSAKVRLNVSGAANDAVLYIAAGLPSEAGPLGLEKAVTVKLKRSLVMEIRESGAEADINSSRIWIDTTSPVDLAKVSQFVKISPEADFSIEPRDGGFAITGGFKPQDRVKVTIAKGLPSAGDAKRTLKDEWSRAFIIPGIEPQVRFPDSGRVLTHENSLRIPVESVNFDKLHVLVWRLYENNIALAMRRSWGEYPTDLSCLVADKNYNVKSKPNEPVRRALDLKPLLKGEKGVFLVAVQGSGANAWSEARRVVNVTDLGLTVKLGRDAALARTLSVSEAKPIGGARVTLWSHANQIVGEGRTDIEGVVKIAMTDTRAEAAPVVAVAEKDGDISYIRLNDGLFDGNDDFDTSGARWLYKGYSAYCYTGRDIFRPGESATFHAVVRDASGAAPKPFPVQADVVAPNGSVWKTISAKLTEEGTFAVSFDIPQDAPTGSWNAVFRAPGSDASIGYKEIYVEEFAAPRMFVEAAAEPASIVGSGDCVVNISGRYTFGSPAVGSGWEAELRTVDRTFAHKDWAEFSFRREDKKFTPETSFIASGALDAEGRAKARVSGERWDAPSMLDLSVRVGVMEDSGRFTYKSVTIPWYPSDIMVGIDARREASPGETLDFRAAAVTAQGKASDAKELKYSLFRRVRQTTLFESEGRVTKKTGEELLPRESGVVKLKSGIGAGSVKIKEAGEYLLCAQTADGASRASFAIYAYGAGGDEPQPDVVQIVTDKKIYKTGDVAKIKIKSPFAGQAWVDAETTDVVWSETREAKEKEAEFSLKITNRLRPNGWITAHVVRAAREDGSPLRAAGAAPLMTDNSQSRLAVDFDESARLAPGKNKITFSVKDAAGRGVAADVAVMITDETILGLTDYNTPDPWKFFTERRMLGTETYDLYGAILTPERKSTPLLTAGGGDMAENAMLKSSLSPVQARRFRTLALEQNVRSKADGGCEATFEIPEFSGRARIMAVAATASAQGSGETQAQIGRDVTAEISLPRFAAPGDKFTAAATLFNTSSRDITVKFSAKTKEGESVLSITGGEVQKSVAVKSGSSATVPINYEAKDIGVAEMVYKASWDGGSTEHVAELPVRPAAPRVTEGENVVVEPGSKYSFSVPEKGRRADFVTARTVLSAAPQISLSTLAEFLATYPYGSFEQTVSSAWVLLAEPALVRHIDPSLADEAATARAIEKIESLQNYDGGFPKRSGGGWSSAPWESLYGAHFLLEARRAGYGVSSETLSASVEYARGLLSASPDDESDAAWRVTLSRRAYASFVLALSGEAPFGWMEFLREKARDMTPSGRLLLACAYAAAGEKEEARELTGVKTSPIRDVPGRDDNYDSNLRDKALTLLAETYIDPSGASAALCAADLTKEIEKGRYNTQEGAFSMIALGRCYAAKPLGGTVSGRLVKEPGDKVMGTVTAKNRDVSCAGTGEYRAENGGSARLYLSKTLSYIPSAAVAAKDDGIELRQSIAERGGKMISGAVTRGAALTAAVTVTPKTGSPRNVAVVLPIPAGFEIETPRVTGKGEENVRGVRFQARDDRLILFIDELEKPMKWHYALRAVTEGTFAVPQIYAECMYDPGISSVSGGGVIKITSGE